MSLLWTPAGVLRSGAGPGTWRKTSVSRGAPRESRGVPQELGAEHFSAGVSWGRPWWCWQGQRGSAP